MIRRSSRRRRSRPWNDGRIEGLGLIGRRGASTIRPHSDTRDRTESDRPESPSWPTGCSSPRRPATRSPTLMAEPCRTTGWDGVRNHQARNFLRDRVAVGDGVLFHHSGANPPAIAGVAEVVEAAHPDPTAFDPDAQHYDPKSHPNRPTWYQVTIRGLRAIDPPLSLPFLKSRPELDGLELLRTGSRLSIQPVAPEHWDAILALADAR